jgi:hypothetical protein
MIIRGSIRATPSLLTPIEKWPRLVQRHLIGRSRAVLAMARRRAEPHVEANRRTTPEVPDLDQVAELVGQPEASGAYRARSRAFSIDERAVEAAGVANLAGETCRIPPDAQRAFAASVYEAVRHHLVDSQHQLPGPRW